MMTVYIDEVFAVNLIMDGLVLWAAGTLAQTGRFGRRLGFAATVGALYAVLIFLPDCGWLATLPMKVGCSLLMVRIAFGFHDWQNYLKCVVYLYLVSFVLGGAAIAVMYLFGQQFVQTWNGIALVQMDFHLFWLAVAAGFVLTGVFFLRRYLQRDLSAVAPILTAQIILGARQVTLRLLVDTGNTLTDPLSARPVIVAEQASVLPLLPESLRQLLQAAYSADAVLLAAQETELAERLRLIPYRAVGQQGMLLGVRSDCIILQNGAQQKQHTNLVVALSDQKFSAYGTYQGLVQPELL